MPVVPTEIRNEGVRLFTHSEPSFRSFSPFFFPPFPPRPLTLSVRRLSCVYLPSKKFPRPLSSTLASLPSTNFSIRRQFRKFSSALEKESSNSRNSSHLSFLDRFKEKNFREDEAHYRKDQRSTFLFASRTYVLLQATRAQSSLGDRSFIMTRGEGRGGRRGGTRQVHRARAHRDTRNPARGNISPGNQRTRH